MKMRRESEREWRGGKKREIRFARLSCDDLVRLQRWPEAARLSTGVRYVSRITVHSVTYPAQRPIPVGRGGFIFGSIDCWILPVNIEY